MTEEDVTFVFCALVVLGLLAFAAIYPVRRRAKAYLKRRASR